MAIVWDEPQPPKPQPPERLCLYVDSEDAFTSQSTRVAEPADLERAGYVPISGGDRLSNMAVQDIAKERDAATQRAEKAEREVRGWALVKDSLESIRDAVAPVPGEAYVEAIDRIVRERDTAVERAEKAEKDLAFSNTEIQRLDSICRGTEGMLDTWRKAAEDLGSQRDAAIARAETAEEKLASMPAELAAAVTRAEVAETEAEVRRLALAHRIVKLDSERAQRDQHWSAYCGAYGRLKAAQERARIANDHRECAEKDLAEVTRQRDENAEAYRAAIAALDRAHAQRPKPPITREALAKELRDAIVSQSDYVSWEILHEDAQQDYLRIADRALELLPAERSPSEREQIVGYLRSVGLQYENGDMVEQCDFTAAAYHQAAYAIARHNDSPASSQSHGTTPRVGSPCLPETEVLGAGQQGSDEHEAAEEVHRNARPAGSDAASGSESQLTTDTAHYCPVCGDPMKHRVDWYQFTGGDSKPYRCCESCWRLELTSTELYQRMLARRAQPLSSGSGDAAPREDAEPTPSGEGTADSPDPGGHSAACVVCGAPRTGARVSGWQDLLCDKCDELLRRWRVARDDPRPLCRLCGARWVPPEGVDASVTDCKQCRSVPPKPRPAIAQPGNDTPYPLADVLTRLADAADHLLKAHDCDAHGYEGVGYARDAARRMAKEIQDAIDAPPKPRPSFDVLRVIYNTAFDAACDVKRTDNDEAPHLAALRAVIAALDGTEPVGVALPDNETLGRIIETAYEAVDADVSVNYYDEIGAILRERLMKP